MKLIINVFILTLLAVSFSNVFGQFTKFDPKNAINIGDVDNYMALTDTSVKYDVTYSLKKSKAKAQLSQTIVDEQGNTVVTNYATRDTGEARLWIASNISIHDSILAKIDAEFTQMEQMQTYIRQEMDKIIDRKKALKRERVIAIRSKEQLKKLKL